MDSGLAGLWPPPRNDRVSIQRFYLDDRGALVAADPERRPRAAVIDVDAADIGRARQLIFGDAVGLRIETRDPVGQHRAGPDLAVLGFDHVVWRVPRRRQLPFL